MLRVREDARHARRREGELREALGIGRPGHDVDPLAIELVDHGLHARTLEAHAGAHRVDGVVARQDRDLRAAADLAGGGADLDDALLDLGHLELEERLHEQRVAAAQDEARPLGRLLDALEDGADRVSLVKVLAMVLLAVRHDRLRFAELVEHDHQLAALDLLHLAGEELADAAGELVADAGALALADALDDALLGRLHGAAPELREVDGDLHDVADLELPVLELRLLEGHLAAGVRDLRDHRLEQHDANLPAVLVDLHLGLHVGTVLLRQGGMNAVLEQSMQLRAIELLGVGQLPNRAENFRRSGHAAPLYLFQTNTSRASRTSASGIRCSTPVRSRISATAVPSDSSTPRTSTSTRPPSAALRTLARRPANLRQSSAWRSGRSTPGDETSSTYCSPTSPDASSRGSSARDTWAQSSIVTFAPSRRSMRTSSNGRRDVPPRRNSTRSKPSAATSCPTKSCSAWFICLRARPQEQKNAGEPSPTFPARGRHTTRLGESRHPSG